MLKLLTPKTFPTMSRKAMELIGSFGIIGLRVKVVV